ncbi:MAG: hypothetical protein HY904_02920 [Deltaproteobacteria bacterium]|nr:hypothetical protein [Deltaproteobacteria bacterium]
MRGSWAVWVFAGLTAGCAGGGGWDRGDAGGGGAGASCLRSQDCAGGLLCVALVCSAPVVDGGTGDAGASGGEGDTCLRSADCRTPLRCVSMVCTRVADGGTSSGGASSGAVATSSAPSGSGGTASAVASSSNASHTPGSSSWSGVAWDAGAADAGAADAAGADGGADAGPLQPGCAGAGPGPRGTGGCCRAPGECASGLCVAGMCSAPCSVDEHCRVEETASPLPAGTRLRCGDYPSLTGRACLPGSLTSCGGGAACTEGESCVLGWSAADGGPLLPALQCTADRSTGAPVDGPCRSLADCRQFGPHPAQCSDGVCRAACGDGVACGEGRVCLAAGAAADAAGVCTGVVCGDAPAGQDDVCGAGEVCAPSSDVTVPGAAFTPRCRPVLPGSLPPGDACPGGEGAACRHGVCAEGACSKLCQWDGDCPAALPFCAERPITGPSAPAVAAVCVSVPTDRQLCRREADCGIAGCAFLDQRSLFSACTVEGRSALSDPACGPSRACAAGRVCLLDPAGTWRCAQRGRVGEACRSPDDCLSGACAAAGGLVPHGALAAEPGRCTSRCATAADCAAGMDCHGVPAVTVVTADSAFVVWHPLCWPWNNFHPCSAAAPCAGGECDADSATCHHPAAGVGAACGVASPCALGLRCGADHTCVREGCVPRTSGSGCQASETCVATGPITGECRRACTTTADCGAGAGLVCVDTDADQQPDACYLR